jgi:hypothetical protein
MTDADKKQRQVVTILSAVGLTWYIILWSFGVLGCLIA